MVTLRNVDGFGMGVDAARFLSGQENSGDVILHVSHEDCGREFAHADSSKLRAICSHSSASGF
jgi:hypothetical protein